MPTRVLAARSDRTGARSARGREVAARGEPMMMRALAVLLVLVSGCSALGLDRFERTQCADDMCCASLDVSMPSGDACTRWQPDPATMYCEILPRDDDGDGAPPEGCGTPFDCDDADPGLAPGLAEACDGADQDCDARIDEGAVSAASSPLAALASTATTVLFARTRDAEEAVALVVEGGAGTRTLHLVAAPLGEVPASIDAPLTLRDGSTAVSFLDAGAIASIGGGRYAAILRPAAGGCARYALATLDPSARTLTTGGAALDPGLPKAGGACPTDTSPVGPASLASDADGDLVAAWISEGAPRACPGASADVVLATARIGAGSSRTVGSAISLGTTDDTSAPALLSIGDDDYLVAIARAGTIVVQRIAVAESTLAPSATDLHTETAAGAGDVHLALGPTSGTRVTIALTWREGCDSETPVGIRLFELDTSTGALTLGAVARLGTGIARRTPRAAYQPRLDEWAIAWRSAGTASVIRMSPAGAPIGEPFEVSGAEGVSAAPLLSSRESGAAYALELALFDASAASLEVASFGCAP